MTPKTLAPDLKQALDHYLDNAVVDNNEPPPPELPAYIQASVSVTFRRALLSLIQKDGRLETDIYTAAGLDRRQFSRLRSSDDYHPDKLTVISFIFVLHLPLDDAENLLKTAGYALSRSNVFDLIVRYYLERGDSDAFHVNDALYTYNQPLLCGVRADDP